MEGSPSPGSSRVRRSSSNKHGTEDCSDIGPENISRSMDMPDAMETVFQSTLALGRHGPVDELIGNMERAASQYSKAVCLLVFLLVEAPSLILNPPFSLTNSDRYRLRNYIGNLNNRQQHHLPSSDGSSQK